MILERSLYKKVRKLKQKEEDIVGFFLKLLKILRNKKYHVNPVSIDLTIEEITALCVGLINSEQTMYFYNSIETGANKVDISKNLALYYEITDEETAIETLNWLCERGHHVYFDAIKEFVSGRTTTIDDTYLTEEEKSCTYEYIKNLNSTIINLMENGYLGKIEDVANSSIFAWDMGRLVLVTRCCCELGYIPKDVAWKYMEFARKKSCEIYLDWKEFAQGYILGRAMWGGSNLILNGVIKITNGLLEDKNSPWKKYWLH